MEGVNPPVSPPSPRAARDAATRDYTDRPEHDIKPRLSAPTNNPPGQKTPRAAPVIPPLRPNPRPFCRSGQIQLTVQRSRSTLPARRVFKQIQQPASTWGPSVGSLGDGCCGLALLGLERSIPARWWGLLPPKKGASGNQEVRPGKA